MAEHTAEVSAEEKPAWEQSTENTKDTVDDDTRESESEEKLEETNENGLDEVEEEEEEKKDEDDEEDDDDDDRESSEEELGSLEKPVEILSRKRDRKSTERYIDKSSEKTKPPEDELDYSKGKGTKLGDIEYVKYMIDKTKTDELKTMHRVLFKKPGKTTFIKKNIREFGGYPFEKDSTHYQKLLSRVDKIFMSDLKLISGVLGLERGGDKVTVKERLIEYLMEPKDLEKPLPTAKKPKPPPKKKKSKKTKKEKKSKDDTNEVSSAGEDSDDEEEEKKVKKPRKKKSESPKKPSKKKDDKKKATPVKISISGKKSGSAKKKTPSSESKRKRKVSEESDDDDNIPLVKKNKQEPTDAEIKTVVEDILKDADLEQITMKTVCKQVYDHFPSFDLTPRKDFIKTTVKEIIS